MITTSTTGEKELKWQSHQVGIHIFRCKNEITLKLYQQWITFNNIHCSRNTGHIKCLFLYAVPMWTNMARWDQTCLSKKLTRISDVFWKKIRIDTVKIDGFKFVYSECYLVSHSDGGFDYWGKGTAVTVSTGEEKLNLKSNYFFLLKTFFMNQMIRLLLSEN